MFFSYFNPFNFYPLFYKFIDRRMARFSPEEINSLFESLQRIEDACVASDDQPTPANVESPTAVSTAAPLPEAASSTTNPPTEHRSGEDTLIIPSTYHLSLPPVHPTYTAVQLTFETHIICHCNSPSRRHTGRCAVALYRGTFSSNSWPSLYRQGSRLQLSLLF